MLCMYVFPCFACLPSFHLMYLVELIAFVVIGIQSLSRTHKEQTPIDASAARSQVAGGEALGSWNAQGGAGAVVGLLVSVSCFVDEGVMLVVMNKIARPSILLMMGVHGAWELHHCQ